MDNEINLTFTFLDNFKSRRNSPFEYFFDPRGTQTERTHTVLHMQISERHTKSLQGYRIPSDRQFSSNFDFSVHASNDPNEISDIKKKSLKKNKYWQRNGGFKFWPEVKITRLNDTFRAFIHRLTHLDLSFIEFSFTQSGYCKEPKLIGNLTDCPPNFTVRRLTHKQ